MGWFSKKKEEEKVVFLQASAKAVAGIKNLYPRIYVRPHGNGRYDVIAYKD